MGQLQKRRYLQQGLTHFFWKSPFFIPTNVHYFNNTSLGTKPVWNLKYCFSMIRFSFFSLFITQTFTRCRSSNRNILAENQFCIGADTGKKMNLLKIFRFPDFIQRFPDFSQRLPEGVLLVNFSRFASANVKVVWIRACNKPIKWKKNKVSYTKKKTQPEN